MTTSLDQWDNGPSVPPDATTERLIKHEWRWHQDDPDDDCPACRVDRGAALLDDRRPGWWEDVDVERLALGSTCRCVLGQTCGDYLGALEWLEVAWPGDYGFDLPWDQYDRTTGNYTLLTILWRAAIERRRHAES